MLSRVAAVLFAITTCLVTASVAGPFDDYVGKYRGTGYQYNGDGSVDYFQQTTRVERGAQFRTLTLPDLENYREYLRFRSDGSLAGSGSALASGVTVTWTITGRWRQVDNVVKARADIVYDDAKTASLKYIYTFREGKLVMNVYGVDAEGDNVNISYRGKTTSAESSAGGSYQEWGPRAPIEYTPGGGFAPVS